jgi:hypothetical protein
MPPWPSWRRRRRRHREDRLARLEGDLRRAVGFLEAVLADAGRLGVPVDEGVLACLAVLRGWARRIDRSNLER